MKLAYFNIFGHISVLLWMLMLVLWLVHVLKRPRRWWCHLAVITGLISLICAEINSATYVNRIQIDQSEEIAAAQARREAARKAAEDARKGEVAQIRFAEDDGDDFLDTAGMDEADKKYLENAGRIAAGMDKEPAWKREKKQRSGPREDNSLEGMLNPEAENDQGLATDQLVDSEAIEPVVMSAEDHYAANRLDALNLRWIRILILLGIVFVIVDYIRRLNVYREAYLPLPLPSSLVNSMLPMPAVWSRPDNPRRSLPEELSWMSRRGDAFVYLTDDETKAARIPHQTKRLCIGGPRVDVLQPGPDNPLIDDDFIFEGLWYNRASFLIDSATRVEEFLRYLMSRLRERRATRARVHQTVHIVWDLQTAIPAEIRPELTKLAAATGWSIMEEVRQV